MVWIIAILILILAIVLLLITVNQHVWNLYKRVEDLEKKDTLDITTFGNHNHIVDIEAPEIRE